MRYFLSSLGSQNYKSAPGSFLFSLVKPSGLLPTKMPLIAGQEGYAICCNGGYGPIFGSGHDLHIPNAPNSYNGYVSLNNTYQCPAGQNANTFLTGSKKNANTFLTGSKNFYVSEMEVFGFKQ